MSVTFWVPAAPRVEAKVECIVCDGSGRDTYESALECPYCKGKGWDTEQRSTLPELNLANFNARAFLNMLDKDAELCGTWKVEELERVETKLMLAAMGLSVGLEHEPTQEGNVYYGGRDSHYVDTRLTALIEVVRAARKAKLHVSWG